MIKNKPYSNLSNRQVAAICERIANTPGMPIELIAAAYNVETKVIQQIIQECWYGPTGETEVIILPQKD